MENESVRLHSCRVLFGIGALTQEGIPLGAGETRRLEGEFVLRTEQLQSDQPLEWIVVYTDPEGFAKQTMVRGETPSTPSMDADAATTSP